MNESNISDSDYKRFILENESIIIDINDIKNEQSE